jgi:hypothetical protein
VILTLSIVKENSLFCYEESVTRVLKVVFSSLRLILRPSKKTGWTSEPNSKKNSTLSILEPLFNAIDYLREKEIELSKLQKKRVKRKMHKKSKKVLCSYKKIFSSQIDTIAAIS